MGESVTVRIYKHDRNGFLVFLNEVPLERLVDEIRHHLKPGEIFHDFSLEVVVRG